MNRALSGREVSFIHDGETSNDQIPLFAHAFALEENIPVSIPLLYTTRVSCI